MQLGEWCDKVNEKHGDTVDEAKEMPTTFGGRRTSDNSGTLIEI